MVLPLLLGLLGSGAAGAGMLGTLSPLIAGALGSGLGSAIETGDIGEGIKTGLLSGVLGGIGGSLTGGAAGATGAAAPVAPSLTSTTALSNVAAPSGIMGMLKNMPSGMSAVGKTAGLGLPGMLQQGLKQGVMSGAGMGTALGGMAMTKPPSFDTEEEPYIPRAKPLTRERYTPAADYRGGTSPEFQYFGPARYAEGGMVMTPSGLAPIAMKAGGIADIAGAMAPGGQMNEKDIVEGTIAAVEGRISEEQAAPILAAFVQTYGEEALRSLVDDVRMGRSPQGGEGPVRGPGDGMADMIPAEMSDGGSDVLLSDGEFVIPADVVSGLGNGSTEAGAAELDRMMGRVRQERTGSTTQPAAMNVGGVIPA